MVKATIGIVVVLSVQLGKMLASQIYKFGTSWVCAHLFRTNRLGSFPKRQTPVSWRLQRPRSGPPTGVRLYRTAERTRPRSGFQRGFGIPAEIGIVLPDK